MVLQTFEQWQTCITKDCKIKLSKAFALQRLAVLRDIGNPETKKFSELYGAAHLKNIIQWFTMYSEAGNASGHLKVVR